MDYILVPMQITHNTFNVRRTAHIYSCGEISSSTEELWVLLHGYSQEADVFLREFEILVDDRRVLLAPQGLSQFYSGGTGGRTAASWMTRSHREYEINDYLNYLDHILFSWIEKFPNKTSVHLLGFSQGAETAFRWYVASNYKFDHLIICSGLMPHDIEVSHLQTRVSESKLSLIHGLADRLIPNEIRKEIYDELKQKNILFDHHTFNGGHKIDPESVIKTIPSL